MKAKAKRKPRTKAVPKDAHIEVNRELYNGLVKCYGELRDIYVKYGNDGAFVGSEGLQDAQKNKDSEFDLDVFCLFDQQTKRFAKEPVLSNSFQQADNTFKLFMQANESNLNAISFKLLPKEPLSRITSTITATAEHVFDEDDFEDEDDILSLLLTNYFKSEFFKNTELAFSVDTFEAIRRYKTAKSSNYTVDDFVELVTKSVENLKNRAS